MTDVASNANATKRLGGVTGKGFKPGQSGNPTGGTSRRREAVAVGQQIRTHLAQIDEKATKGIGRKTTRLQALIMRLEKDDPKILLAYAFGKPVETHEHSGPEGNPIQFLVKDIDLGKI